MKEKILLSLLILMLLNGCGDTTDIGDTQTSVSLDDDDDYEEEEDDDDSINLTISYHNQGADCLSCHTAPAENADGKDYLSGGTVYTTLNGSNADTYASGYTIRLLLDTNLSIDYIPEKGTGNSYSENSALSSAYYFTGQVLNSAKQVIKSSNTNSHSTTSHLSCNKCHTSVGENGAPGRVTIE